MIKFLPILSVAVVAMLGALPVVLFGLPMGHDGITHASWQTQFYHELASGTFYPRWLPNSDYGTGSPVFFFYPPLAHYMASLVTLLLGTEPSIFIRLGIAAAVFYLASGMAFYAMARVWFSPIASVLGAVAYLVLPYHYGIDLWTRVAYAEFAAYAITPLVFWAQFRISKRLARIAALALAYGALILTHLPSALILSCVMAGHALAQAIYTRSAALLLPTGCGMVLGLVLTAVYLLPALSLQYLTNISALWMGRRHYSEHFLFHGSSKAFLADIQTMLLVTTAAGVAVSVYVCVSRPRQRAVALALLAASVACWILMTPISQPLWRVLPILYKIEFPWRLGIVIDLLTALAIAMASAVALESSRRLPIVAMALLVAALGSANILFMWQGHYGQQSFRRPAQVAEVQNVIGNGQNTAEYQLVRQIGKRPSDPSQWAAPAQIDVGQVRVAAWQNRRIVLQVSTETAATLTIRQNFVPLWQARASDGTSLTVAPSRDSGLLQVKVPKGETEVRLILDEPASERIGYGVTIFGLIAILAMLVFDDRWGVVSPLPAVDKEEAPSPSVA